MARVAAHVPDLLFGSRVQALLLAGGHDVTLSAAPDALRQALAAGTDVLVLDLTADADAALELHAALAGEAALDGVLTLAFYSHVEADTREAAEAAGIDQVVPRSRMAREGAALVDRLVAAA